MISGLFSGLDTGSLAGELTHVEDLRATDFATTDNIDLRDSWGVDAERTFDADTRADLTDGEGFTDAMSTAFDDNAFVDLDTFLLETATVSPAPNSGTSCLS